MTNQLDTLEDCVLQIGKHCFLPLPRAKEYLESPTLASPRESPFDKENAWLYKKKKKKEVSKQGPSISKGEQMALQVVFTD